MAKKSSVEKNNHRKALVKKFAGRRARLLAIANDENQSMDERFLARLKLAELPRNSAGIRVRNRCSLSGRPRGFIGRFGVSRLTFRELALNGKIPGVTKSSW